MMPSYGPSPTETWSQYLIGSGARHLRAMAKVRLRLHQSARGYSLAAELAGTPPVARFAGGRATERVDALSRFDAVVSQGHPPVQPLPDVAGTLHRWWMRRVASDANPALLREIDRGEASLERAIRSGLQLRRRSGEDDPMAQELDDLLSAVEAARRAARELSTVQPRSSR